MLQRLLGVARRPVRRQHQAQLVHVLAEALGDHGQAERNGDGADDGAGAGAIQSQLNYTREHEREADRIGYQILDHSGFDVNAMPVFFERLQRATRTYESNAPSYLRTHPLTTERTSAGACGRFELVVSATIFTMRPSMDTR